MTPAQNFRAAAVSLLVAVFIILVCCLSGCDGCNTDPQHCAISCATGGGRMHSYTWSGGCICAAPPPDGGAR